RPPANSPSGIRLAYASYMPVPNVPSGTQGRGTSVSLVRYTTFSKFRMIFKKITIIYLFLTSIQILNGQNNLFLDQIDKKEKLSNYNIPDEITKCLDGKCVSDQFFTVYLNHFAIVAANNVRMRSKPSLKSNIIKNLNIGTYVNIIFIDEEIQNIGGLEGNWTYVKENKNNEKGWVFSYYLATPSKFKIVNSWHIQKIHIFNGDYNAYFNCDKFGLCQFNWTSGGSSEFYNGSELIKIKQYLNIVYFPKNKEDDFPIFFYLDKNIYLNTLPEDGEKEKFIYERFP
ncbi:SH3 domain-containing protein, partial [Leptospira selangorensis]